jgi:hypothetical protein
MRRLFWPILVVLLSVSCIDVETLPAIGIEARIEGATNFVEEHGTGTFAVIKHFDDEVFRILSGIADDPSFWNLVCEYKKVPQVTPSVGR